jgi:hypothetical protein
MGEPQSIRKKIPWNSCHIKWDTRTYLCIGISNSRAPLDKYFHHHQYFSEAAGSPNRIQVGRTSRSVVAALALLSLGNKIG